MSIKPGITFIERIRLQRTLRALDGVSDDDIRHITPRLRQDYLYAIATLAQQNKDLAPPAPADMTGLLWRLLHTTPYPANVEAQDRAVTARFYKAWRAAGTDEKDPRKLFIRDCWLAAASMRMPPSKIDLRVRRQDFSRIKAAQDFEAIANVRTYTRHNITHAAMRLNTAPATESDIWTKRNPNPITRAHIAAFALHEVTHVEQEWRSFYKQRPIFYSHMAFQRDVMRPYIHQYAIYRATLTERQGYLRQEGFLSLTHRKGTMETEAVYLARAWHERDMLTKIDIAEAATIFCDTLKLKP